MMISSAKVLKRLEALLSQGYKDLKNRETPDGDHCYQTAIRAYKTAIEVVDCEAKLARERNPEMPSYEQISLQRRCQSALHAAKMSQHKRAIQILEKVGKWCKDNARTLHNDIG